MSFTLDGRVLPGWMRREQAVLFLLNECWNEMGMSPGIAGELWREYRTRVEELPVRAGAPPRTFPLDAADREAQRRFLVRHPEASDVTGFVRVNPMDLQVHQLQVVTDPELGHPEKQERDGWLRTAMPEDEGNHPIRWRMEQGQLVFELPHGEFVLTAPAPPDAHMQIAPLPSYVSVAHFEGRTLLVNGYHRTFAWLERLRRQGQDIAAEGSLLFPVSSTLPFPDPPDLQSREILLGPRPPLFADFFDERLALPVKLRRNKHYEMRVRVEIAGVHESEAEEKARARSAGV